MKKHLPGGVALSLLAACSGGGGGGDMGGSGGTGSVTPTPTPTATASPTPTPSPSPTPTPSYPLFSALAGDQSYASACTGTSPATDRAGTLTTTAFYYRGGGPISYAAATQTYTVYSTTNARNSFVPADRDNTAPANVIAFSKPSVNTPGTERFQIIQPSAGGVSFDYSRTAFMDMSGGPGSGNVARSTNYCILGVPTLLTDIPSAPIVTFTRFAVGGEAQDSTSGHLLVYTLAKSSATMQVDLTTGMIAVSLHLVGTNGGTDKDFGTFSSTTNIDQSNAGFFGVGLIGGVPAPGVASLPYQGGFFGPQGKEFAYAFSKTELDISGRPALTIIGTVNGAR
ncbi:hypothetical protein [Sphingomonas sp. Sphisp66]|uniref:hypothetical protein n=1 Tax=Sphingomonas sp. Sphisp66 TaxID=3243051 RepID=UPI0039B68CBF